MNRDSFIKSLLFFVVYVFISIFSRIMAQNPVMPRSYVAHRAFDSIIIDGKDDEYSWHMADYTKDFIDIEGKEPAKYKTKIKMLWDSDFFYVHAWMEEPHVWGNLKKRDTVIFYNNDFEVFIDPDGDTHNYYELEINSLNTVWDLFLTKPYRNGGKVLDSWNIQGLKTAVNIEGTLNDPSDNDRGWSLEIGIPWSVITEAANHGAPPDSEYWRINFSRVNWDFDLKDGVYTRKKDVSGGYLHEYNWVWSPQGVINMHEPERWGYVFFSSNRPEKPFEFKIPKDEYLKNILYEWYRKLHDNLNQKPPKYVTVFEERIPLNLEVNKTGWNLWLISPFSNKQLIIRNDGKFIKEK